LRQGKKSQNYLREGITQRKGEIPKQDFPKEERKEELKSSTILSCKEQEPFLTKMHSKELELALNKPPL